jgi:hypothetical protein
LTKRSASSRELGSRPSACAGGSLRRRSSRA